MRSKRSFGGLGRALLFIAVTGIAGLAYAAGTSLSISFDDATVDCASDGSAQVTIHYTVTSTAAADEAAVTGQIDEGDSFDITTIPSGNVNGGGGWTFFGRVKTFSGTFTTTLDAGSYTFTVCAEQHGTDRKSACNTQTVTVDCQPTATCEDTSVFGELPHNTNLCSAQGVIEIQFHGSFGENANLTISGPNGFTYSTTVGRNGNSCNYHYNWDLRAAGGTGNGGAAAAAGAAGAQVAQRSFLQYSRSQESAADPAAGELPDRTHQSARRPLNFFNIPDHDTLLVSSPLPP